MTLWNALNRSQACDCWHGDWLGDCFAWTKFPANFMQFKCKHLNLAWVMFLDANSTLFIMFLSSYLSFLIKLCEQSCCLTLRDCIFLVWSQGVSFEESILIKPVSCVATYLASGRNKGSGPAVGWRTLGCNWGTQFVRGTEFVEVHSLSWCLATSHPNLFGKCMCKPFNY